MKKVFLSICLLCAIMATGFAKGQEETKVDPNAPAELVYWVPLNANISAVVQSMKETEYSKELEKRTNTQLTFQHVAGNDQQVTEAFNILVASGDYPDVMEYKWVKYPGGPQAAINDGVILPLNDIFEKYAPNISKYLEENPDIARMIRTEEGQYYVFPFLRGESVHNNPLLFSEGWVWRLDLLNKLGLEIPQTPAEVYTALKGFKSLGIQTPLTLRKDHVSRALSPAYDSWDDFYIENGKVRHGLIDPARKNFLEGTAKWYKEGLLDNDYFAVDRNVQATKILNSVAAATYAPGGSGMGAWIPAFQQIDPSVKFTSSPPLSPVRGRNAKFSKMNAIYNDSGYSAAISATSKNVEAAARLLDYNYSAEGHMLANFGIEGVSYNMVNGYPTYTDLIMKNPKGLPSVQAMSLYIRGHIHGPFIQDARELEQYYSLQELKDALTYWPKTDMGKYMMPTIAPSQDKSEEYARIMNNVNTYKDEMEAKFITGALPISEFTTYQKQLKSFGIERAIAIMQDSYDTYMSH